MSSTHARLLVESGPNAGQEILLTSSPLSLGRETVNDIIFSDPEVSRRHARLLPQEGGFVLEDAGSTNGTYVNEQRLTAPRRLVDGDRIRLGEAVRLRFALAEDTAPLPVTGTRGPEYTPTDDPAPGPGREPAPAARYEPPSVYQPSPTYPQTQILPTETAGSRPRARKWLVGCGLIVFLAVVACGASIYWLDAYRPDLLYGPLRAILQLLGIGG